MSEITTKDIANDNAPRISAKSRKPGLDVNQFIPFIAVVTLFVVFSITAKNFFTVRSVPLLRCRRARSPSWVSV
jgi:hypothetical protein